MNYIISEYNGHVLTLVIPRLGCGLGGLKWDKVKPITDKLKPYFDIIYSNDIKFKPKFTWKEEK